MFIRRTDTVQNTEKNLGEKQQGSLCSENSTVKQGDKTSKHLHTWYHSFRMQDRKKGSTEVSSVLL